MEKVDIVIIGAGVVGLAAAAEVSQKNKDTVVIERHPSFGQEASSRNSEVIHSGLYCPKDSLKARLCLEGKRLLYQLCEEKNIPHKRIGKLIVATEDKELKKLEELLKRGKGNGVEDLKILDKNEIEKIEPHIRAIGAIYSPSTGVVDTHQLMKHLEYLAKDKGTIFAYGCEVTNIEKQTPGYKVHIRDADGQNLAIFTRTLLNSAGLNCDKIAQMAGIDIEKARYKLDYFKGEYFRLKTDKSEFINHLIYPTPKDGAHLGIHTVSDLSGQLKLGPNSFLVEEINYDVDSSHRMEFYEVGKKFLPFIEPDNLTPDMAGIRARLHTPCEQTEDFVISNEDKKGFPNFINLIGIDSPGLTSCLAIAKYVDTMIK